ncbi:MAG: hypothetical protein IJO62_03685 [Clostridia bacterium]|nr:hypothetical protein [Clostridia bacterium]
MFKYRILTLILITVLLLSTVGCSSKTDDAYIYFELPSTPVTLDPQTASSDAELLIVRNIYEGLMRKNDKGEVVTGAAEEYQKNDLSYIFTLREDIFWSNGEKLTAKDFVFGLIRAVDPQTQAPFASRLLCIQNAGEIANGRLSPEKLGVRALSDRKILINLEYDDKDFLENLTTSVAMPCNEKFFEKSAGKYGLFKDKIICNGSYRLSKWNKESFGIRLYKNEEYNGGFKARNAAVFLTCNHDEDVTQKLSDNHIDIAFINVALTKDMESKGFKTDSFQNICWVMTLSSDFSYNMRTALLKLVGNEVYGKSLKRGYSNANSLFPKIFDGAANSNGYTAYDLESGKDYYSNEVKQLDDSKFPSDITLYYYDNGFIKPIVTDIVGHWQSNLSAFVNIEAVDNLQGLLPQLKEQTLSMAIFPVRADSKNSAEYLKNYTDDYENTNFTAIQENILSSKNITPLFFEETALCYSPTITEVFINEDNGFIDFAFVIKQEN